MPADELAVEVLALSNGLALEDGIDPDAVRDDLLPPPDRPDPGIAVSKNDSPAAA